MPLLRICYLCPEKQREKFCHQQGSARDQVEQRQVKPGQTTVSLTPAIIAVPGAEFGVRPCEQGPSRDRPGEQTQGHEESHQSLKEGLQQIH